jgi:hypothetical protein
MKIYKIQDRQLRKKAGITPLCGTVSENNFKEVIWTSGIGTFCHSCKRQN